MNSAKPDYSELAATVYPNLIGLPSLMTLEQTGKSGEYWGPRITRRISEHCEVIYVVGGTGRVAVDDHWFDAGMNCIFFIPPMIPLDIDTQEENKLDLIYAHFHFKSDRDYLRLRGPSSYLLHEVHSFDSNHRPNMLVLPDALSLPPDNHVLKYMMAGLEVYSARDLGFYQEACLLVLGALHQISRGFMSMMSKPITGRRGATAGLAGTIRSYISAHIETFAGMKELGDSFNMNSTHLARAFKAAYGESIVSYVSRLRIELAKKHLATTDMTIPMLAEKSGFRTPSHFRRVFKTLVGLSPVEFRAHRALVPTPPIEFRTPFDSSSPDARTK
jgi:AraC-like DNA-binding protein